MKRFCQFKWQNDDKQTDVDISRYHCFPDKNPGDPPLSAEVEPLQSANADADASSLRAAAKVAMGPTSQRWP